MNTQLFSKQFSKIIPSPPLRVSSYAILTHAEKANKYIVSHGCTGALIPIDKNCYEWLSTGAKSKSQDKFVPDDEILKLVENGILTFKTQEQERASVKQFIGSYFEQIEKSGNASITVILSYDCNFRCTYCTQRHTQLKGDNHLSLAMNNDVMDACFEFIRNSGTNEVTLFGGEPLMPYPEHIKRVERFFEGIRELGGMRVNIVSNGYSWKEYENVFKSGLISNIQVTIDGPPEVHDQRRLMKGGGDTFYSILSNVAWALDLGVPITARINVDHGNVSELSAITKIFEEKGLYRHGIFTSYISPVQSNGYYKQKSLFGHQEMFERMLDHHTLEGRSTNVGEMPFNQDYLPTLWRDMKSIIDGDKERMDLRVSYCGAYASMMILDPYGDIYPCWDFVDHEEHRVGSYFPEVKLDKNSMDLWRGRGREVIQKDCLDCPYVLLHGSGCQAEAYRRTGEFWERDCEDFSYQFDLALRAALGDIDIRGRDLKHSDLKCSSCGSQQTCST